MFAIMCVHFNEPVNSRKSLALLRIVSLSTLQSISQNKSIIGIKCIVSTCFRSGDKCMLSFKRNFSRFVVKTADLVPGRTCY